MTPKVMALAVISVLTRLSVLAALFGAFFYGYFWLTDGCPDTQRIADLPPSSQKLIVNGYPLLAIAVLLLTAWLLFRRRKSAS